MDDLISRQAAIMHFVKAAKKYECGMFDLKEATHELWEVPSAEPEQTCEYWDSESKFCALCRPSAQPERKKGRWEHIYIKRRGYTRDDRTPRTRESAYCTACRAIVPELKKISRGDSKYRTICNVFNFCPNCGADMRGGEDDNIVR